MPSKAGHRPGEGAKETVMSATSIDRGQIAAIRHRTATVLGRQVFYREAGDVSRPTVLLLHGFLGLVAPACLLFYGLALLHTSKYTLPDIRYLAFSEISLGLLGTFFIGYGLLFWAIGFGLFHILYGTRMYQKQP